MLALIMIYCLSMGVATFIEKDLGMAASRGYVYHHIWFIVLQVLISVNAVAIIKRRGLFSWKSIGSLMFHLSFIVIFCGAMTTHLFSKEGVMHIREGYSADYFVDMTNHDKMSLPFTVLLNDFVLTRYPGSQSPSSYESHVTIEHEGKVSKDLIRMNHIVNVDGYRLFQTSFDKDEKGTVLTVNYDFPGMQITYLGYILLLLGIVITPFQHGSRFRRLNRKFKALGCVALFMMLSTTSVFANTQIPSSVSKEHAAEFGRLLIQNHKGRIEPVNTWSSKILRKIHSDNYYGDLTADQMFLNLFLLPDVWAEQPIVKVKNKDIRELLKSEEYANYNHFFSNDGKYKLQKELDLAYAAAPAERSKFSKDIISLDEVINIIFQLQGGRLMPIFPDPTDSKHLWLSPGDEFTGVKGADSLFLSNIMMWYASEVHNGIQNGNYDQASKVIGMIKTFQDAKNTTIEVDYDRVEAEILYNRLHILGFAFKFYLIFGGILLVLCITQLLKGQTKLIRRLQGLLVGGVLIIFALHTFGFLLRWYVSNHGPWSNSYETMVFVAWSVVAIGVLFIKKSLIVSALSSILAGVLLFVSSLNWMNPEITPLVPVLQSYWLMIHVAVIMLGYGFFFISALIGLSNLVITCFITPKNKNRLVHNIKKTTIINEMSMILGTFLLCLGIFLGAVWANVSWGRYWGWDPKETWALITMMCYVAVLHMRFIPKLDNIWLLNVKSLWLILSVLMTYFGVNYYLSGLHSYGSSDGSLLSLPVLIGLIVLLVVTVFSLKGRKYLEN